MIRRLGLVASLASLLAVGGAGPALAHGLGGRVDLPVPRWLFVYGAGAAVVLSFMALAALWREPRLQRLRERKGRRSAIQAVLTSPVVEWIVRGLSLAIFVVVVASAFAGVGTFRPTLAPVFVYVWFWVGLSFAHAVFGNLWATLSPWDTLGRLLRLDEHPPLKYPRAWGKWPAAVLLFGFVWLELVDPFSGSPRSLGLAIVAYTAITLVGMVAYGREAWNSNGEAFAVYFGLLSRISPLARDGRGRVVLRPVLGGLPSLRPQPGLVAVIMVALGSTTFDGLSRSTFWLRRTLGMTGGERVLFGTIGILAAIGAMTVAFELAMFVAGRVAGTDGRPLSVRFVHSVVPIALAYAVAHYFSFLLIEGQLGLARLSDPFGRGWDLIGTAEWTVNLSLISATLVSYVQVAAIVAGHVGGVVLAHDRAIAIFPGRVATRTQYALLAVMVLFTVTGLLILFDFTGGS